MSKSTSKSPEIEWISITSVEPNETNPRYITDTDFQKLCKSIQDFPQMMQLRPIVVEKSKQRGKVIALGGNMRLRACKHLGWTDVPIVRADNLTDEQRSEFILKDNIAFGQWDYEILANNYNIETLSDWGMNIPKMFLNNDEDETSAATPESKWYLNIELQDEQSAQKLFERLQSEGYNVKIVL
jgi:hypothetical protein